MRCVIMPAHRPENTDPSKDEPCATEGSSLHEGGSKSRIHTPDLILQASPCPLSPARLRRSGGSGGGNRATIGHLHGGAAAITEIGLDLLADRIHLGIAHLAIAGDGFGALEHAQCLLVV